MPDHTTHILDTIPADEFRRRFAFYVGRIRKDVEVIIIRRNQEDQIYLITEADWAMIEQALALLDEDDGRSKTWGARFWRHVAAPASAISAIFTELLLGLQGTLRRFCVWLRGAR